jgi:hypothetical protein
MADFYFRQTLTKLQANLGVLLGDTKNCLLFSRKQQAVSGWLERINS